MLTYIVMTLCVVLITLACMLVFGARPAPPPLESMTNSASSMNLINLPPLSAIKNKHGKLIAYRSYTVSEPQKLAIMLHGSAMESRTLHGVARYLQAHNIASFVPDIRGHGATGTLGDIDYVGQLEDDLENLLAYLKNEHPQTSCILLGFSAGGGFALRVASSHLGKLFDQYVLLAPLLHHSKQTSKNTVTTWAQPFLPRLIALTMLDFLGLSWFQSLPVMAFAIPHKNGNHALTYTPTYSYKLQKNFRPQANWQKCVKNITRPLTVIIGQEDELFLADQYQQVLTSLNPSIQVRLLPGLGHAALCREKVALQEIVNTIHTDVVNQA